MANPFNIPDLEMPSSFDVLSQDYKRKKVKRKQAENKIIAFLKTASIPFDKNLCISRGENFVQEQLFALLHNHFPGLVEREKNITGRGRIDFVVGDTGVEVKIFRSFEDYKRLVWEIHEYTKEVKKIVIPYINAGGISPKELNAEFVKLQKEHKEIKGIFELNVGKAHIRKAAEKKTPKVKSRVKSRKEKNPFDIEMPEISMPDLSI